MDSKGKAGKRLARKRGVKFVPVPLSMDLREMPPARPEMQQSALRMVQDREVGRHRLGDQ